MSVMKIARRGSVLAALLLMATAVSAQETQVIRPGMTMDEVKAVFGAPQGMSSYGSFTFYFYDNGCEPECGFPDIVFFQGEQVVDAVLRAPWRDYAGESSSPKGTIPRPTPGGERLQMPTAVESVEIRQAVPDTVKADTVKADTTSVRG